MKDPATPTDLAPLPGENENDPLVCIETEDGFMEWLPLSQLLKSRQQSLAVPTSDAQKDTDLVPYMEQQCLVREKSALQSQNKELQSRLEYISRCYNEQSDAFTKREQALETQNKALQVQLDGACVARDSLRCELDGMKKKFSPRNLFARSFALLLCVAFLTGIICFSSGKKSGYDSGYQDGNEEGLTAGYDSGYDEGEKSGYGDGYDDGKIAGERQGLSAAAAKAIATAIVTASVLPLSPPSAPAPAPAPPGRAPSHPAISEILAPESSIPAPAAIFQIKKIRLSFPATTRPLPPAIAPAAIASSFRFFSPPPGALHAPGGFCRSGPACCAAVPP